MVMDNQDKLTFLELLFRYPGLYSVRPQQSSQIIAEDDTARDHPITEPLPWVGYKTPTISEVVFGDLWSTTNINSSKIVANTPITNGLESPPNLLRLGTATTDEINGLFETLLDDSEGTQSAKQSSPMIDGARNIASENPHSGETEATQLHHEVDPTASTTSQPDKNMAEYLDTNKVKCEPPTLQPSEQSRFTLMQKYEEQNQKIDRLQREMDELKKSIVKMCSKI